MKKRKLRWDRIIGLALIIFAIWTGFDIATAEPIVTDTPVGAYTCKGHIIKACSGSSRVANYLGV